MIMDRGLNGNLYNLQPPLTPPHFTFHHWFTYCSNSPESSPPLQKGIALSRKKPLLPKDTSAVLAICSLTQLCRQRIKLQSSHAHVRLIQNSSDIFQHTTHPEIPKILFSHSPKTIKCPSHRERYSTRGIYHYQPFFCL